MHRKILKLTKISAITRGCRMGLSMKTKIRVAMTTKITCRMKRGRAKSKGLSPCHIPFVVIIVGE